MPPLVAKAPKIGFNLNFSTKNLLIATMCLVFTVLFLYDGFYAYPHNNDRLIKGLLDPVRHANISDKTRALAEAWKDWANESPDSRKQMDAALKEDAHLVNIEGWKSPFDVTLQRVLAGALVAGSIWSIWRFVKKLRLRVQADDAAISPRAGIIVPWDKITKVDNTLWHTDGIVYLTYTDAHDNPQQAEIDEYKLDPRPLLPILELLAEKAAHAEFLPKVASAPPPTPAARDAGESILSSDASEEPKP